MPQEPAPHKPRIVVIGAGFAGLAAAKALRKTDADVVLVDRRNHHVFQPLLYQIATAALSPAQIAQPTRFILRHQKNCTTVLAEVTDIDTENKTVRSSKGDLPYDYLIVATGATHTYFGRDDWAPVAPGLKSIEDALNIRGRILDAFEQAETCADPERQKALLTFVVVGGGATGVEMAGAIAELARHTLPGEFRRIQPDSARILLVEAGPRILPAFADKLSTRAARDLTKLGVEVLTQHIVKDCTAEGALIGDDFIPARTIVWSAGVKASAAAAWLHAAHDKAGRVIVNPDLSLPHHPEIFVIGDTAHTVDKNGITVPGLAPAAAQAGQYAAKTISAKIRSGAAPAPFVYKDYGTMATIGRGKAIARIGRFNFSGFLAWYLWGIIHLFPLIGYRNRMIVAIDWFWSYLTKARSVRLITVGQKEKT
ncbi:MAG TPA: NAD(P)/FAD-dependent oxidoreductase [Alphaproteobacteria bacterium]|nr:NAD(P)/FAD-dependent oxidoreductase [Alphaproteobacteria bacterium]